MPTAKNKKYSKKTTALMVTYQQDEITASVLYSRIAKREKNAANKKVLMQIAAEEKAHAAIWQNYTSKEVAPKKLKIFWYTILSYIMGYTFVIKLMENGEYEGMNDIKHLEKEIPEVRGIIAQEKKHEKILMDLLDEERLQYVGAMVLGLNDALVELTGTIAGLTFALMHTKLVALAGIITGVSATLSMAASNYLAERANNNPKALKASVYTGVAYLVTVVLLVLPYLIFPNHMYAYALGVMLATMVFIIFFFNYYISVAKSVPFFKRFAEMAVISLGVAAIAFGIGLLAKNLLNIDV